MDNLLTKSDDARKRLGVLSQLPKDQAANLQRWYRAELTYTSNALEGNTLSRQQTASVIDKDISVAGKTLTEHLEAVNHAQAVDYIYRLAGRSKARDINIDTVLQIHSLIMDKIDDSNAGRLRRVPVRVAGSTAVFPNYLRVSDMLDDLLKDIRKSKDHTCLKAAWAHLRFVSIHPFVDGNGRTARLLMNLILLQDGWPPAIIRKEDRIKYLELLETAKTKDESEPFCRFILRAINHSLNVCLQKDTTSPPEPNLVKIGTLARMSGESVSTLRHWSNQSLLTPADISPSGYRWYDTSTAVKEIKRIKQMQKKRFTLEEIKNRLGRPSG